MSTSKKTALIFLAAVNLINIVAGVVVQIKIIFAQKVTSVLPITVKMTDIQVLLLNFIVLATVIFLISIIVTYLVTDIPYSPIEIIRNCPQIAFIPIALLVIAAVVSFFTADGTADKICIAAAMVVYTIYNIINFGAMVTIKEDD